MTLGRPSSIQDFDCDVERPVPKADDPIDLFVQNIELSHIAGLIHQGLYSPRAVAELAKMEIPQILDKSMDIIRDLDKWKAGLPAQFQLDNVSALPTEIIKLYLYYYNLLMSVHRSHADIVCCSEECVMEPARAMIRLIRDTGFVVNTGCWYVFLCFAFINHNNS